MAVDREVGREVGSGGLPVRDNVFPVARDAVANQRNGPESSDQIAEVIVVHVDGRLQAGRWNGIWTSTGNDTSAEPIASIQKHLVVECV